MLKLLVPGFPNKVSCLNLVKSRASHNKKGVEAEKHNVGIPELFYYYLPIKVSIIISKEDSYRRGGL